MNRNNFLPHIALALVLILVAAFAGQLRRWQGQLKHRARIMPASDKQRTPVTTEDIALGDPREVVSPEIMVKFKPGVTRDAINKITLGFNDRVEDSIESVPGLESIDDIDELGVDRMLTQYRNLPEVEYAEQITEISLENAEAKVNPVLPADPQFSEQWALANNGQRGGKEGADISALRAWAVTTGNDDVVIAVLDSGVDYTHPDLANNIWSRPATVPAYHDDSTGTIQDLQGYNAIENNADPMDQNGHGTHCAGIIGAEGGNNIGIAGVNWTVRIMPLKFMNAGGFGTTKDAIEAINYVIDRRKAGVNVKVISASWGSTMKSQALEDVIRKAYDAGILFVAAAGNATTDNDRTPHYPSSYPSQTCSVSLPSIEMTSWRHFQTTVRRAWRSPHPASIFSAPGSTVNTKKSPAPQWRHRLSLVLPD